ncbi:MAG: ribosome biogenesis GTP-binding protein YihA/YsxC [Verrucomicrobiales bacterium]|jgi:GTP-binding protein|nr:ribosome biogenesis GTP-binding protein YihA/YsxC [Verrucomicrobiales bacterium]MDP4790500.1 ribosome biogenesis GTP-binding protein YihA/YsxC [Verrucomicrobiales bacterium]MDP5005161.1 ribosome biogenesis GTP-binding protein YihA/YsxC [Verrucomicrobiales bacterium]
MKITSARFATSFDSVESCPAAVLPEFAFIGRSNVGKSSLINMLCNQAGLAKVSSSPGHTRLINFFVVNEDWCLVDLPGYGYARAPKSERNRFNDFVADYLEFREGLTHVFVLIDSRHDPQKIDIDFVTWLVEKAVPFSLIFTKSDKLKPSKVAANRDLFLTTLSEYVDGQPPAFITSVKDKTGRMDVLSAIREMKKA